MFTISVRRLALLTAVLAAQLVFVEPAAAQTPSATPKTLTSETPDKIEPTNDGFDYVRRSVMIPMRDGVKAPHRHPRSKGASKAPILLTRTPLQRRRTHQSRPQLASWPQS